MTAFTSATTCATTVGYTTMRDSTGPPSPEAAEPCREQATNVQESREGRDGPGMLWCQAASPRR